MAARLPAEHGLRRRTLVSGSGQGLRACPWRSPDFMHHRWAATRPSATDHGSESEGFGKAAPPVAKGGRKAAGKKQPPQPASAAESRELRRVLKQVEEQEEVDSRPEVRPQSTEGGKVDFARVSAWGPGTGGDAELESLRVRSFSESYSAKDEAASGSGKFYDALVGRIQLLDSKGDLAVASAKPLPPFERWSFKEEHYLQFLADQAAVHAGLEDAVAAIVEGDKAGGAGPASVVVEDGSGDRREDWSSFAAVATFHSGLGLRRAQAVQSDMQKLASLKNGDSGVHLPAATTQATSYAKYIRQLGRDGMRKAEPAGWRQSRHQLLAHIFAVHVAHLTTGMRVGARAIGSLPRLVQAKAVSFYRDYPANASNPLKVFTEAVNEAGLLIGSEDGKEEVMQELPKAIQRTSLLLAPLAVEEETLQH
eukprot:SM000013S26381  [mRNA]  locus=s13:163462:166864:+ [translate_table: standard]